MPNMKFVCFYDSNAKLSMRIVFYCADTGKDLQATRRCLWIFYSGSNATKLLLKIRSTLLFCHIRPRIWLCFQCIVTCCFETCLPEYSVIHVVVKQYQNVRIWFILYLKLSLCCQSVFVIWFLNFFYSNYGNFLLILQRRVSISVIVIDPVRCGDSLF